MAFDLLADISIKRLYYMYIFLFLFLHHFRYTVNSICETLHVEDSLGGQMSEEGHEMWSECVMRWGRASASLKFIYYKF